MKSAVFNAVLHTQSKVSWLSTRHRNSFLPQERQETIQAVREEPGFLSVRTVETGRKPIYSDAGQTDNNQGMVRNDKGNGTGAAGIKKNTDG